MIGVFIRCNNCGKDSEDKSMGTPLRAHRLRARLEKAGWVCGFMLPFANGHEGRTVDLCPECTATLNPKAVKWHRSYAKGPCPEPPCPF